jgi:hypothetical protein
MARADAGQAPSQADLSDAAAPEKWSGAGKPIVAPAKNAVMQ